MLLYKRSAIPIADLFILCRCYPIKSGEPASYIGPAKLLNPRLEQIHDDAKRGLQQLRLVFQDICRLTFQHPADFV